jgi:hypothetical protein
VCVCVCVCVCGCGRIYGFVFRCDLLVFSRVLQSLEFRVQVLSG